MWVAEHIGERHQRTKDWESKLCLSLLAWGKELPEHLYRVCKDISAIAEYQRKYGEYRIVRNNARRVALQILQVRERRFQLHYEGLANDQRRAQLKSCEEKAYAAKDLFVRSLVSGSMVKTTPL